MIAAYAFLAMFALQIVAMSIFYPAWFIRASRRRVACIPIERLRELYHDRDMDLSRQSFYRRYRGLNYAIAAVGLGVLYWLYGDLERSDWPGGPVEGVVAFFFVLQTAVPFAFVGWHGFRFSQLRKAPQSGKRTATLERRGLFDFISPAAVVAASLAYPLFGAYVLYASTHGLKAAAAALVFASITLVYALEAYVIYRVLYGKKTNPFETHAGRLRTIGLVVRSCTYSCIVCVVYVSLNLSLTLFHGRHWEPFALCVFFSIASYLSFMTVTGQGRSAGSDGLGASPAA